MAVEYRREVLENIARNELKQYDPSLINGEPRAIPIEDIVERHYRLDVEYHYLRHRELYAEMGFAVASAARTSLEIDPATERQADILAIVLLMPAGQVKRAFYAFRNARLGGDPAAALAELFGVSKQAMGIFLREHRLA